MEMKQCPQCGKYVAADRTYCMNCGVTLGVRCTACRAVSPVGSKVCASCGHSFVQKKKRFRFPLLDKMKRYARPLLCGGVLVLLLFALVAAAYPAMELRLLAGDQLLSEHEITGYELMQYFLSADPDSVTALLALRELKESVMPLQLLFFGAGIGWLSLFFGLAFAVCLLACNLRRIGKLTVRRLFLPLGVALGGGALLFGLTPIAGSILSGAMQDSALSLLEDFRIDTFPPLPLILLCGVAVLCGVQTLLYLTHFRTQAESEEELPLGRILSVPVNLLLRGLRRVWRALRKKSKKRTRGDDDEPSLAVTPRFTTYLVLFGLSLVFTQALLSKISHIFFWFVFLLPFVLLVYVLLAARALAVTMRSETATTEKNAPYTYDFRISNRSPLSLPFVEALVSIPQSNSVRCSERIVRLAMAPLSGYHLRNTVHFRFRGTYDIGVKCFYVYDFFRIFRVRVDVDQISTVYVLPRRLTLEDTLAQAVSDSTARTVRSPLVVDKLEVSDIRDYRNGDSLKSIHWKLSSKAENFVVKDYNTGTSNQTVVFCDLAPHYPDEPPKKKTAEAATEKPKTRAERRAARKSKKAEARAEADRRAKAKRVKVERDTHEISDEALQKRLDDRAAAAELLDAKQTGAKATVAAATADATDAPDETEVAETASEAVDVQELAKPAFYDDMNEFLADGVVELTIASVLAELRQGHEVLLLWFDRRSDTGVFGFSLRGADEFENIYHLFATAPVAAADADCDVTSLTAMVSDIQSAKQMFVISALDTEMLSSLVALPGISDAGSFGSAEVMLYEPEGRFKFPGDRALYLQGCREQLAVSGLSLTAGSFNIAPPQGVSSERSHCEGGIP